MPLVDFISPALILSVGGFIYKALRDTRTDLRGDVKDLRNDVKDLRNDVKDLHKRIDLHLEGHAPKLQNPPAGYLQ